MKVLFLGTPRFAVPTLEKLIASPHEVSLVVTQPDRKVGRGQTVQSPPVKRAALAHGLPVIQPATIRDAAFLEQVRNCAADVAVVVAYGKILPPAVLETPRLGCINIHASLLPAYRGAAPINWALINGEIRTGVTIMQMDAGMDTGPILAQEGVDILEDDDAESVGNLLSMVGAVRLIEALDKLEAGAPLRPRRQDEALATYAPLLKKEDGRIDWSQPSERIICRVRGVHPWPGGFTTLRGEPLKIRRVQPVWETILETLRQPVETIEPGTVALLLKGEGFVVRAGTGFVLVTEAQPAGKRALSAADLINGQYVRAGDRLGGTAE